MSDNGGTRRKFSKFKAAIPDHSWSHLLSLRYHLLWLSGSKHESQILPNTRLDPLPFRETDEILRRHLKDLRLKVSSDKRISEKEPGVSSVSRLHFDRFENVMTVIRGFKRFYLFPPTESSNLYGGTSIISGTFTALPKSGDVKDEDINRNQTGDLQSHTSSPLQYNSSNVYTLVRLPETVNLTPNLHHTYSPTNILDPDLARHPRVRLGLKSMQVCDIQAGDQIFVPAHWWHQVSDKLLTWVLLFYNVSATIV